jgi:hypothetical protein
MHISLIFLCLEANVTFVPKFQFPATLLSAALPTAIRPNEAAFLSNLSKLLFHILQSILI